MSNKASTELPPISSLLPNPLIRYWDFPHTSSIQVDLFSYTSSTSSSPKYSSSDESNRELKSSAPKRRHLSAPPSKEKPWEHWEHFQPAWNIITLAMAGQKQHCQARQMSVLEQGGSQSYRPSSKIQSCILEDTTDTVYATLKS